MMMKTRFYILLVQFIAVALTAQASQITNSVNITTNLVFYLTAFKSDGAQSQFKSEEDIIWALLGTSTNYIGYRHFPSGDFEFHLFDGNGREIQKTKAGLDLTGAPRKPTGPELASTRQFIPYAVNNDSGECRHLFRPDDVFLITNKGVYEMEVRIRLCVIMANGMPDLKAMTDWRNSSSFSTAKDFGILTSPPLRVTIVKK